MDWGPDLEAARRRLATLDPERDLASVRAAAVSARAIVPFAPSVLPLPQVTREWPSLQPEGMQVPDTRVEFDAHGRPVVQLVDVGASWERAQRLWEWDEDGSCFELELDAVSGPSVHRARAVDGQIVHVATAGGGADRVQLLTWSGVQAVRAEQASIRSGGGFRAVARVAEYDADGELARILVEAAVGAGDLAAGLARAAALRPEEVRWDGRVARPEPWPDDPKALVTPLAAALDAALRDLIAEANVDAPYVLEVEPPQHGPAFPPIALLVGARWRDRSPGRAAILNLQDAVRDGEAVELDVTDRLDAASLRACRALSTAFDRSREHAPPPGSDKVADALGERLAKLLHGRQLSGTADPFIALVEISGRHRDMVGIARARRTAGGDRVARFLASLEPPSAPADRAEHTLKAGLRLVERAGARSRLGAPPLLPRGTDWPAGPDGKALTFLAAIDLSELPPSRLPATGWLLFFADPGDEEEDGLIDEAPNEPGALARVYATDDPIEADGPALAEIRVAAQPFLVDEHSATAWIGGPDDEDGVLLLALAEDAELGFSFMDAGSIEFRIPATALAARDWSQVLAIADSA